MGDRIAVMRTGEILQLGDPLTIYQTPVDRFVGGFIGNPPMNFVSADLERSGDGLIARVEEAGSVAVDPDHAAPLAAQVGKPVTLGVRAENIEVLDDGAGARDTLRARVLVVEPLGSHDLLTVQMGKEQLKVSTRPDKEIKPDQDIALRFEPERTIWLDPETDRTIGM
jgi:multiple sugar transport system ATP-binding protein